MPADELFDVQIPAQSEDELLRVTPCIFEAPQIKVAVVTGSNDVLNRLVATPGIRDRRENELAFVPYSYVHSWEIGIVIKQIVDPADERTHELIIRKNRVQASEMKPAVVAPASL